MTEPIYDIVKSASDAIFATGQVNGRAAMKLEILKLMEASGVTGPSWENLLTQVCNLSITEKETKE
jgi:hypothetical protein